ncbi:MAG: hypothetical protein HKM87_11120 [Ignavibacteriaceae bacterium]|nr:hypothetical protein [Ignavibacteriaceae bacterium]
MSYWIDIVGSFVIAAIVTLILTNVNISVSNAATENLTSGLMQRRVTSATDLIEYDLYKIGYRTTSNKIAIADSNEIKFDSDIDNDGVTDEIHYVADNTNLLTNTSNPEDYLLTRTKNNMTPAASIVVVDFKLNYYDSLGQEMNYSSLTNQSERDKIKTIRVKMECESEEMIDGHYEAVEWMKKIKPKNI